MRSRYKQDKTKVRERDEGDNMERNKRGRSQWTTVEASLAQRRRRKGRRSHDASQKDRERNVRRTFREGKHAHAMPEPSAPGCPSYFTHFPPWPHTLPRPIQLPEVCVERTSDAASWMDVVILCPCLAWLSSNQSDSTDSWQHCDTSSAVERADSLCHLFQGTKRRHLRCVRHPKPRKPNQRGLKCCLYIDTTP